MRSVTRPHHASRVRQRGGGERLTLRVVARYVDGWNFFVVPVEHVQHKLDVLRAHCAEIDREYGAIRKQLVGAEAGSAEARARRDIVRGSA